MRSSDQTERTSFWIKFFDRLREAETESAQLGFSNENVMIQNTAFIVECAGRVSGRRVLDCGCGSGRLARVMMALGGTVTAFDPVGARIDDLARRYPDVTWAESTIDRWVKAHRSGDDAPYDIVIASEVLQHVGVEVLPELFSLVSDGGRLVATVPNADCPIVSSAATRFDGHFTPVPLSGLRSRLRALVPDAEAFWRGLRLQDDQRVGPYMATSWNQEFDTAASSRSNRVQLVLYRQVDTN